MRREKKTISKMDDEDEINKFLSEKVIVMMLDSGKVKIDDIEQFVVKPVEEHESSESESETSEYN